MPNNGRFCIWQHGLDECSTCTGPRRMVGRVEVNGSGGQPDRLSASVGTDGVHLQLRNEVPC